MTGSFGMRATGGRGGRAQRCRAQLPIDGCACDAGPGADGGADGYGAVPQAAEGGGQGKKRSAIGGGVACEGTAAVVWWAEAGSKCSLPTRRSRRATKRGHQ